MAMSGNNAVNNRVFKILACRNAVDCVRDIGIPPGRIAARRLLEAVHLLMSLRSSVSSGDWEGVHDLIGETVNPLLMERRKKVEALNREDEKKQESSHGRTGTFVELNFDLYYIHT